MTKLMLVVAGKAGISCWKSYQTEQPLLPTLNLENQTLGQRILVTEFQLHPRRPLLGGFEMHVTRMRVELLQTG